MTDSHFILKKYWEYDNFRPLQEDIINAVLSKKDVLALLPTGGGKSICFQVPAMMMEGICLVVSPLIALMKDQVENLKRKGIPALAVYSGMHFMDVKKTLQNAAFGSYKFLYVSPERLETNLFLEFLPAIKPNLIVIDEAHCVSQWGYDFRPPYLRIASLREYLPEVPVIALTASATKPVRNDICEKLLFNKSQVRFTQSFERANLSYSVFQPAAKQTKLIEILKNVPGSAIVYCKSRKHTQQVASLLKLHDINADFYHAGLSNDQRTSKQENWIKNKTRVIVCTNAFGMGIDKPDVRVVVHFGIPDCIENYYQEAGRAGRDGRRAYAVLLYDQRELNDLVVKIKLRYPPVEEIKKTYTALMNYLQVAAGSGETATFDFDIVEFTTNFKLDILQATYCIQAMAQEDLLSYNEVFFKPSVIEFNASKSDLAEFELQHPELQNLLKGLLRTYEGIFDYPSTVYESSIAKFLKVPVAQITDQLKKLQQYHIIKYQQASEKPQVFLLKNRMYSDDFKIDTKSIEKRRAHFEERVNAIIDFVQNKKMCRSKIIAAYFGDYNVPDCNICDNCINNKETELSALMFQQLTVQITSILQKESLPIKSLIQVMKPAKESFIWKVIDYLIAEGILVSDGDSIIRIRV